MALIKKLVFAIENKIFIKKQKALASAFLFSTSPIIIISSLHRILILLFLALQEWLILIFSHTFVFGITGAVKILYTSPMIIISGRLHIP